MQKTFRLDPKQLKKQLRNVILIYGVTGIIAAVFMLYTQRESASSPWLLVGALLLMMVYFGYRAYRQRKEIWDSYSLELTDDGLTLCQPKYPNSQIAFNSISAAEESRDGLWLSTAQGNRVFIIPNYLSDFDFRYLKGLVNQHLESNNRGAAAITPGEIRKPDLSISAVPTAAEGVADDSDSDLN